MSGDAGPVHTVIRLASSGPPVITFGAYIDNAICVTHGDRALVCSADRDPSLQEYVRASTCGRLCDMRPACIACDRDANCASSQRAGSFAACHGLPLIEVQHHHAHIAAIAAEHRIEEPLLGIALDEYGVGDDGGLWGGELLHVDDTHYERVGRLSPLPVPKRNFVDCEPWRMAVAALYVLGDTHVPKHLRRYPADGLLCALRCGLDCAFSSSAGCLFEAAAGLIGVTCHQGSEGRAALLMEELALRHGSEPPIPGGYCLSSDGELDFLPLLEELAACGSPEFGAAAFYSTLAAGIAEWAWQAASPRGLQRVALGGCCFLNRLLRDDVRARLARMGIETVVADRLAPDDTGIALGQAWVARKKMAALHG